MMSTVIAILVATLVLAFVVAGAVGIWLAFRVGVRYGRLQTQVEDATGRIRQIDSRVSTIENDSAEWASALANRIGILEKTLIQVVTRQQEMLEATARRVPNESAEVAVIQARGAVENTKIRNKAAMKIVGAVAVAVVTLTLSAFGIPVPHTWHIPPWGGA